MMNDALARISKQSDALLNNLQHLFQSLGKISSVVSDWKPFVDLDVKEVLARADSSGTLCKSLSETPPERFRLVSQSKLLVLSQSLESTAGSIANSQSTLDTVLNNGGFGSFEAANGVITAQNGNRIDFGNTILAISQYVDQTLDNYLLIAMAVRPKGIGTFSAASRAVAEQATTFSELIDSLEKRMPIVARDAEIIDEMRERARIRTH